MKADINFPQVVGVTLAIVREPLSEDFGQPDLEYQWRVFIINQNDKDLHNIIIASKGYGTTAEGNKQETSVLRHLIEELPGQSAAPIEIISPEVFHLVNEYWVSYYIDRTVYDKKFLFMPDSIIEGNLQPLPFLDLPGVLHN
jgi:hypothetical protein